MARHDAPRRNRRAAAAAAAAGATASALNRALIPTGLPRGGLAGRGDLDKALGSARYKPRLIRICAVRLELAERSRPRRRMPQKEAAATFDASARVLRKWVKWHNDEGVEGLKARGGQGRKPGVPPKWSAARLQVPSNREEPARCAGGTGTGTVRAPPAPPPGIAARPGQGRGRPRGPADAAAGAKSPASASAGKEGCECPRRRPPGPPPGGPRRAPDCPRAGIAAKNATTMHGVRRRIHELSGKKYGASYTYSLMARRGLAPKAPACAHVWHADLPPQGAPMAEKPSRPG